MKTEVSTNELLRVAELSKFTLTQSELLTVSEHIADVLSNFGSIDFENIFNVGATDINGNGGGGVGINDLRADEPVPSVSRSELIKNSPTDNDGYFVVPRIVE